MNESLEFHEYANLFPLMDGAQLQLLTANMEEHGFFVDRPIMLYEGKILDGRNRYLASRLAGVMPRFNEFTGTRELALRYVKSENFTRNHYTEAQRALIGARLKAVFEEEALQRKRKGGAKGGKRSGDSKWIDNLNQNNDNDRIKDMANLPYPSVTGLARDHAAAEVGVSGKSVDHAAKVLKTGAPELIAAVERGDLAVSTAATLAELPADAQQQLIANADKPTLQAAAKILRQDKAEAGDTLAEKLALLAQMKAERAATVKANREREKTDPFWISYNAWGQVLSHAENLAKEIRDLETLAVVPPLHEMLETRLKSAFATILEFSRTREELSNDRETDPKRLFGQNPPVVGSSSWN